ncbi:MAG: hypothetical protein ACFFKA_21560, partial [Candidatus Thorarchaeota archaeon]
VGGSQNDLTWLIRILLISFGIALIGFVTIFSLYIKYWRYPPLVRKIRKLKNKVRKEKKIKPILLRKREEIIKSHIQEQDKILSKESIQSDKITKNYLPIDKEEALN